MRAMENTEGKVLKLASSYYEARGLPPAWVNVLWTLRERPSTSRVPELANELANLVEVCLPEQGGEVAIKHPNPA